MILIDSFSLLHSLFDILRFSFDLLRSLRRGWGLKY